MIILPALFLSKNPITEYMIDLFKFLNILQADVRLHATYKIARTNVIVSESNVKYINVLSKLLSK